MILSLVLLACACADPAPKVQEPAAAQTAPDADRPPADDTPSSAPNCSEPAPPKPRCPPKPGTNCEQMWKKVEAWEAKCQPQQPEAER
jgi:hypothetical protein